MIDELIRRTSLFAALDDEAADALAASMTELIRCRGEVLFHEGDTGDRFYVVVEGKVKLSQVSRDGRENLFAVLGPGDMFGELSLFDPRPRTATATALSNIRVLELCHDDLTQGLHSRPEVAVFLLGQLARRIRRSNEVVADLVFCDVGGRLAHALLDLSQRFGVPAGAGVHVPHDLNQVELAHLVGSSRESVNKVLSAFASRGWLRVETRAVVLLDLERLRRRAKRPPLGDRNAVVSTIAVG